MFWYLFEHVNWAYVRLSMAAMCSRICSARQMIMIIINYGWRVCVGFALDFAFDTKTNYALIRILIHLHLNEIRKIVCTAQSYYCSQTHIHKDPTNSIRMKNVYDCTINSKHVVIHPLFQPIAVGGMFQLQLQQYYYWRMAQIHLVGNRNFLNFSGTGFIPF